MAYDTMFIIMLIVAQAGVFAVFIYRSLNCKPWESHPNDALYMMWISAIIMMILACIP